MGSKMAIVILGLLAMLLLISSDVTAINLNEGEVVKETNETGGQQAHILESNGRFLVGVGRRRGGGISRGPAYCLYGCCGGAFWGGCYICCTFRG